MNKRVEILCAYFFTIVVSSYGNKSNTVKDIDGNVYHTVTIGTQTWMVENLKTTHYNDGKIIPNVTDNDAWAALSTPAYCWYKNDITKKTYGALYNWYTVNTGKLAPTGWHVATDAEWTELANYLGGESVVGGKLKEAGTENWNSPNVGATNETGFSALPSGERYGLNGVFNSLGIKTTWWASTEGDATVPWERILYYGQSFVDRYEMHNVFNNYMAGLSVRCVRDNTRTPSELNNKHNTKDCSTTFGTANKPLVGNVTDIDGNKYHTVTIGNQTWMAENLKTTHYRNGDPIPNITEKATWATLTTGAWCNYDNNAANGIKYGHLYNWFAVIDNRNIAPTGWHVPTDAEWTTLVDYVSANPGNSRSAAKALASTTDWETTNQNTNAIGYNLSLNNSSGFSALPGGFFDYDRASIGIGSNGDWWSSTQDDDASLAGDISLLFCYREALLGSLIKLQGISVRCVKD
jgi:uncharacterized protein (TIGR02145 family)